MSLSENLPFLVHELPLTYERLQKCIYVHQSPSSNRHDGYIRRLDGYYHRLDGSPNPSMKHASVTPATGRHCEALGGRFSLSIRDMGRIFTIPRTHTDAVLTVKHRENTSHRSSAGISAQNTTLCPRSVEVKVQFTLNATVWDQRKHAYMHPTIRMYSDLRTNTPLRPSQGHNSRM